MYPVDVKTAGRQADPTDRTKVNFYVIRHGEFTGGPLMTSFSRDRRQKGKKYENPAP